MDTKILLENGTNELEVLEFTIGGNSYGINVAKIKEIISYQTVTPVPNAHPSIEGIFMPRDKMITAIDLKNCLQRGISEPGGLFIVTNFNKLDIAFHVESVVGIHRLSWADIIKPDSTVGTDSTALGVIKVDNKLIIILDFEKIIADINPETGLRTNQLTGLHNRKRCDLPILVVEDSILLNKLIVDALHQAGYENIIHTTNGQEAYSLIDEAKKNGNLKETVKCVITDIEMPIMDGHHLVKLLKSEDATKNLPVIIFSSLINDEMRMKGEQLGVDAQLSKPEIGDLVKVLDSFLLTK